MGKKTSSGGRRVVSARTATGGEQYNSLEVAELSIGKIANRNNIASYLTRDGALARARDAAEVINGAQKTGYTVFGTHTTINTGNDEFRFVSAISMNKGRERSKAKKALRDNGYRYAEVDNVLFGGLIVN